MGERLRVVIAGSTRVTYTIAPDLTNIRSLYSHMRDLLRKEADKTQLAELYMNTRKTMRVLDMQISVRRPLERAKQDVGMASLEHERARWGLLDTYILARIKKLHLKQQKDRLAQNLARTVKPDTEARHDPVNGINGDKMQTAHFSHWDKIDKLLTLPPDANALTQEMLRLEGEIKRVNEVISAFKG